MSSLDRWASCIRSAVGAAVAVCGVLLPSHADALPTYEQVRNGYRSSDAVLLDRTGGRLQSLRTDMSARRGPWVTLEEISPTLQRALIVSEDRTFYAHQGVEWRAVAAAAWGNLWNTRTRGASTVTMQLAGLLDADLQRRVGGRSLAQKVGQATTAVLLERSWSKRQILEAYLNLVPFRGEAVGVSALARRLFAKHPNGLNNREGALAAALVRAPNAPVEKVSERGCRLLRELGQADECLGLESFARSAFMQAVSNANDDRDDAAAAPHLARKLLSSAKWSAGSALRSTLDGDLQRFANATLQRHLRELTRRNVEDGAIVVLDNRSGEVLAWVGSSGTLSAAREVDGVTALRQAGSTLKPFLYGLAIEERRLTAASLLDDRPVDLPTGSGLYTPQNYDNHFSGLVSVRTALASSLNVPAVRALVMLTPASLHRRLLDLGLPLKNNSDYYGYSLALGSADISLLTLTNAYRALANQGAISPVRWLMDAPTPPARRVMTSAASFIIGDILSDREARTRTFGLDSPLTTRFWTAVKTGTSKDMRDNWCVGWSDRYTVGVWVGNASGAPMWDVSGVTGAAPIWHALMDFLHAQRSSEPARPPDGVVRKPIRFEANLEPPRAEWFLPDTVLQVVSLVRQSPGGARTGTITSPQNGTLFALDPDIPPTRQRVWFTASRGGGRWQLDGKPVGSGATTAWLPWPGRHVLALQDAAGKTVDQVSFEVRGAMVQAVSAPPR